jgi:hypothetical protein
VSDSGLSYINGKLTLLDHQSANNVTAQISNTTTVKVAWAIQSGATFHMSYYSTKANGDIVLDTSSTYVDAGFSIGGTLEEGINAGTIEVAGTGAAYFVSWGGTIQSLSRSGDS